MQTRRTKLTIVVMQKALAAAKTRLRARFPGLGLLNSHEESILTYVWAEGRSRREEQEEEQEEEEEEAPT